MVKGQQRLPLSRNTASKKLWAGRFGEDTQPLVEAFTRSFDFDRRLASYDIQGSIAHCRALAKARVLSSKDAALLIRGLQAILQEFETQKFRDRPEDEDVHMAIERRLTERVGPVGGKLHTGRSRNDQVALDLRLYVRDRLSHLMQQLRDFQMVLLNKAASHLDIVMPGYTHLQRAQPVLFSHHLLAYVEMIARDRERCEEALGRVNVMPLGSGALAGNNYPIDRILLAKLLGFPKISQNSLDAVSDRDFVIETISVSALLMMHLSRLSEELVLWSTQEFQFVELPDGFCTGSSMMPQKKNPDIPELVRGKTGRVFGHLQALLTVMKGLPLSYNRDMQEDKEPLFDAVETASGSVEVISNLMAGLKVNRNMMTKAVDSGGLLATELADYLVTQGVPFRKAHAVVGRIVREGQVLGKDIRDFTLRELQTFSPQFGKGVLNVLSIEGAIKRKSLIGGTNRTAVRRRIQKLLNAWK